MLGEVNVQFMSVCPLLSYTENFMMIQQDLAEICEFQSKCLTGRESRERVESRERGMIIMSLQWGGNEVVKACTISLL